MHTHKTYFVSGDCDLLNEQCRFGDAELSDTCSYKQAFLTMMELVIGRRTLVIYFENVELFAHFIRQCMVRGQSDEKKSFDEVML